MRIAFQWLLLLVWKGAVVEAAFVIQPHTHPWRISGSYSSSSSSSSSSSRRPLTLAAAKGFGNTPKRDEKTSNRDTAAVGGPVLSKNLESSSSIPTTTTATSSTTAVSTTSSSTTTTSRTSSKQQQQQQKLNQGQMALEKLRRERQEARDEELRKVREIRNVDKMLQESPESGVIPEKVATRMGARMLPFVGIPLFVSMATFVGFWYLTTVKNLDIQPTVVGATTSVLMVASLLGITYSVLSASWEPDQEGSLLGVDEFKQNLGNIREGLGRARENTLVREKMKGLPEEEIEAALAELERRESPKSRETSSSSSSSLESKITKELD